MLAVRMPWVSCRGFFKRDERVAILYVHAHVVICVWFRDFDMIVSLGAQTARTWQLALGYTALIVPCNSASSSEISRRHYLPNFNRTQATTLAQHAQCTFLDRNNHFLHQDCDWSGFMHDCVRTALMCLFSCNDHQPLNIFTNSQHQ
jgi:hypothetical protein